jgi:hypothetical protein
MKKLLLGLLIFIPTISQSQEQRFPKEINLVFDYLLKKDYPEKFGDTNYQIRPIGK